MDPVREDRYLDRAYGVYIFAFRRACTVYYNIYYIRAACLAIYYTYTARSAIYNIRTARLAVYYIYTTRLAIYNICATCSAIYNICAARLAIYYNIYYIYTAFANIDTNTSKYLTTSFIYP